MDYEDANWVIVGMQTGTDARILRKSATVSIGGKVVLLKHQMRPTKTTTQEASLFIGAGLKSANIGVQYGKNLGTTGDGIISFNASYNPITGKLSLTKTVKSGGSWTTVGTEVQKQ